MIADILTVARKEYKEILRFSGGRGKAAFQFLFPMLFIGIFMPLQMGEVFLRTPIPVALASFMAMAMVIAFIADSFAGERERGTLESLLATRLSDEAILYGKLLAPAAFSWSLGVGMLLLAALTLNLAGKVEPVAFYSATIFLYGLLFALLTAGLASGVGVLVSLRASSVRQAQQNLGLGLMVLFFIPSFGIPLAPKAWRQPLFEYFRGLDLMAMLAVAAGVLLAADLLVILLARARFRRGRLIAG